MLRLFDQLAAVHADGQQEPHAWLLSPRAGPVEVRVGAAHVRPHGAPGGDALVVAVLDFPALDGPREVPADRADLRLAEVAVAFGIGACQLWLERLLAGMGELDYVGLAGKVKQQG